MDGDVNTSEHFCQDPLNSANWMIDRHGKSTRDTYAVTIVHSLLLRLAACDGFHNTFTENYYDFVSRTATKIPKRKEKWYLEEKKILFGRKENFTSIFRLIRYLIP